MSPWAPKRPCPQPGCPELTDGGKCERHRRQYERERSAERRRDPRHAELQRFYGSDVWKRARAEQLAREPYCRICRAAGRTKLADTVDHLVEIRRGGDPLDPANLQSVCKPCHGAKSIREGSRFG